MNKRQFEINKFAIAAKRLESWIGLANTIVICIAVLVAISLILQGIVPIIGQEAECITAMATLVESFHLGNIFAGGVAVVTTGVWYKERKGKQRAITQKAELQKQLEAGEPNRGTSGLTLKGLSPTNHE